MYLTLFHWPPERRRKERKKKITEKGEREREREKEREKRLEAVDDDRGKRERRETRDERDDGDFFSSSSGNDDDDGVLRESSASERSRMLELETFSSARLPTACQSWQKSSSKLDVEKRKQLEQRRA